MKSARQMQHAVMEHATSADVVVMAAAVADYRPAEVAESKMKKGSEADLSTIKLTENPDILAGVVEARRRGDVASTTKIVGFAAETGDENSTPLDFARKKLQKKGCDLLMCNAVGEGKVFGQPNSSGWILRPNGTVTELSLIHI